jgi:hypothetical protein
MARCERMSLADLRSVAGAGRALGRAAKAEAERWRLARGAAGAALIGRLARCV